MTNPTSNFGWQMPTSTDLVTDLPADFEVFGQAVDTDFADLLGGANGYILSKASATDLDFAWIPNDQGDITAVNVTSPITGGGSAGAVTIGINAATTSVVGAVQLSDSTSTTSSVLASTPTATKAAYDLANTANTAAGTAQTTANAAIPKSTVTTAGDVIYATGSSAVTRLGIGTAGQVLKVNSGATAPEWATAGGSDFVLINTTSFSAVSSQQVNSIFSSTYDSYRIFLRFTAISTSNVDIKLALRISSDVDATSGSILTVAPAVTGASAVGRLGSASTTYPGMYTAVCDLMSPNLGTKTNGVASGFYVTNVGFETAFLSGFAWNNNTQYTGLTISPSAGTMTGTIQVYGYKA
jgi:hypothetical protein